MAQFLVLKNEANTKNVGMIVDRSENFQKKNYYKMTEQEVSQYLAMSPAYRQVFINEKIELQNSAPLAEKKSVEVVTKQVESVSVSTPETYKEQEAEELNEPINEVEVSHLGLPTPTVKAKGRPKKAK